MKWRILCLIIFFISVCVLLAQLSYHRDFFLQKNLRQASLSLPLILWWNAMPHNQEYRRLCRNKYCIFSSRRKSLSRAQAILFYGSNIKDADFPLPRQPFQIWALFHEESPRNVEFMPYNSFLQHFNFTSTISRQSDVPLTTYYLPKIEDLTTSLYLVPIAEKTQQIRSGKKGLVLFMQSDCDTSSGREYYVKELMKYIRIDSYGSCLRNAELPLSLKQQQHDYLNNLFSPEVLKLIASYKFTIAYENGVCSDYITEKFWRPLIAGSIPIYFGAPNIKDWIPNEKSFIDISSFGSPKKLAEFLKSLHENDTEYNGYLNHKYRVTKPIQNKRLLKELERRTSSINDGKAFEAFECAVCLEIHKSKKKVHMASELDYQCPHQLRYPPIKGKMNNSGQWNSIMQVGKCKALVLNKLLFLNKNFTENEFIQLLNKELNSNNC